jgi:3alpha(or 20beta)-hydroxysteroid dehydrogenase
VEVPDASGRLAGKVALVSGAARGMGAGHARAMVAHGARVVLGDVLDADLQEVADELGDRAVAVHLDVTRPDQWERAVATAVERFGSLNVLVNNAGIINYGAVDEYAVEQWDAVLATNLTGVFHGIRAAVGALKAFAPSSIVNVSSVAGIQGYGRTPGYTAAKFGVRGLTKAAALDLGRYGIRVNSVHPGAIATPMTADLELTQAHVALGRVGDPREVSDVVVFLAGDESSFCTGAEFVVDGGETAGRARNE